MYHAQELYNKAKEVDFTIDMEPFKLCNDGARQDVLNTERSGYYQWLPKLINLTQPKQVVELGGAMGVACIAMLQTLPKDSRLYSITLAEHGLEFSFLDKEYPNLTKVVGSDLDLSNWPKDLDLSMTDIWFIDSEHTYEQVRAEIDLYKPFFKEGTILLFDDIAINEGLKKVWEEIKEEIPGTKYESDLHYSGYGIVVVGKEEVVERDPHLIVYGSSYDRGLEHLLKMWPDIRKSVSDARLRIFYGWHLFDVGYRDNPERMNWKQKMNELMQQEGITHLGRISQKAVTKEFEMAGVWAYPTHFGEISCITAMKAQAYGAIPCVINYAALEETVQFGVKVKGDIYDQETKDLFKNSLIALLNDEKYQEQVRSEMMPWAKNRFPWLKVAIQWNEEFTRELTEGEKLKKFDVEVEKLLEDNQTLKAWDLVKDTDWPRKDRLWLRVKHAFNPEDYKKYYSEQLVEHPIKEEYATQCDKVYPRFQWLVQSVGKQGAKTVLDLGCADGYVCLTLAKKGLKCVGYNLYEPSIKVAKERAKKNKLICEFYCDDLFNATGTYDAVILMEVLEHLPNPQKAIDHCMNLVAEGGSFYISTPSPQHQGIQEHKSELGRTSGDWDDGLPSGHLRIFTDKELRDMLKNYKIQQFLIDQQGCFLIEVKHEE
jgi:2-polyprenyl-3-methyl-5-hydroxy-6-metoxy-1,4-benzoquinol methylase/glycosyltransferase involved in cell wall biosynthesis